MENTVNRSRLVRKLIAIAVLVAAWQIGALIVAGISDSAALLMPTWGTVFGEELPGFAAFKTGVGAGAEKDYAAAFAVLASNTLVTIRRVLLGLLFGGIAGIGTGIVIGIQPRLRSIFYPVVRVLRNIPLLALTALFLVWFGGKENGIVIYISFGLWVIYCTNTIEAIVNADKIRINFARTLGADNAAIYKNVVIPMVVPNLIAATKVALGVAWAVALGGEFLAAQSGLGRLLILSQSYMKTGRMLIILILFIALTELFGLLVKIIGARLTRWMP